MRVAGCRKPTSTMLSSNVTGLEGGVLSLHHAWESLSWLIGVRTAYVVTTPTHSRESYPGTAFVDDRQPHHPLRRATNCTTSGVDKGEHSNRDAELCRAGTPRKNCYCYHEHETTSADLADMLGGSIWPPATCTDGKIEAANCGVAKAARRANCRLLFEE